MLELDTDASVGTLIRELYLNPTGITEAEAAALCDLSVDQFRGILTGDQVMNHQLAFKLARGFNTHISFFQTFIPKPKRAPKSD